ncbi:MAG: hypothetical protein L0H96_09490 [Humibacillus sp.]|nr:hypothetical protein [Humibacillus sp.]MDN5777131.1 hypothetical protein [Humibacillus sp.]
MTMTIPVWEYEALAAEMSPAPQLAEEQLRVPEVLPIRMAKSHGPIRTLSMIQLADDAHVTVTEMRHHIIQLHAAGLYAWDPVRLTHVQAG